MFEISSSVKSVFIDTVPTIFLSLFLLILGWIFAKVSRDMLERFLNRLKIDRYIKLGKRIYFSELLSLIVFWIIFLIFSSASISILKIDQLTNYFNLITNFIINLLSGIIIIIIGYSISTYIQNKIIDSGFKNAEIFSKIVFIFSMIITIEMALKIIGLPTQLLDTILIILISSVSLGLAIAFGLGLKDIIAEKARKTLD